MTPSEYYRKLIASDQILPDAQQANVIAELQVIFDSLTMVQSKTLFSKLVARHNQIHTGLYLWGDVGVGKTFLMDCFYHCLPFKNKLRIHFLKFMQLIQEQLKNLQGETDPLEKIAKNLAKEVAIICFDELVVNDIADAMLLAGLFKALYQKQICLIFTSNCAPDNLYLKGLQRDSFLPAIELIKAHSKIMQITTQNDYRRRNYVEDTFYYSPLGESSEEKLQQQFVKMSHHAPAIQEPLILYDREIKVRSRADGVIWFDFLDICGVPRSKDDYIAIANKYHTILISNIVPIEPEQNDLARTFISLVDVFYDANKKLIISADKPIEQLYLCGRMLFEFARTRSRLYEMQTPAWQQRADN